MEVKDLVRDHQWFVNVQIAVMNLQKREQCPVAIPNALNAKLPSVGTLKQLIN